MSRQIALKASNGQFVCAEGGGGGAVNANRNERSTWETFHLIDVGPGKVGLQTTGNPRYVCAEGGGGGAVVANRTALQSWETFSLEVLGGGQIALRASNGMYVCAEGSGGREVVANRAARGPWETFQLVELGDVGTVVMGAPDVKASAQPWGLVLELSHAAAGALVTGTLSTAAVSAAVAAIPAAVVIAGVVAGALAAVAGLVKAVDKGHGVYLTMLWITPGLFVPTTHP